MADDATRQRLVRGYAAAVVVGLLSAGIVAFAVARPWVRAHAVVPRVATIDTSISGGDLVPLAGALGFVLLAAFGAVIATRGMARRIVGGAIVVASILVLASALRPGGSQAAVQAALSAKGWAGGSYSAPATLWRLLTGIAALGCTVSGLAVAAVGHRWPTMGARYDGASARASADAQAAVPADQSAQPTDAEIWREIDRGIDPTQG